MLIKKPLISKNSLINLLKTIFYSDISSFSAIVGGNHSQAYSFSTSGNEYVIRISNFFHNFEKDKYAYEHFSTKTIHIPRIIETGKIENSFYSISEKILGRTLNKLDNATYKSLLPEFASKLEDIHRIDISNSFGYGDWGKDGNANHHSWRDFLIFIKDDPIYEWDKLFSNKDYEYRLFQEVYKKIVKLSDYASEERVLIHGDFGHDNVITDSKHIIGVLDWGLSKYGDFVYDIAWRDFWSNRIDYAGFFKAYCKNRNLSHYDRRILCYKLYIGLAASGFFSRIKDKISYKRAKNKLQKLL